MMTKVTSYLISRRLTMDTTDALDSRIERWKTPKYLSSKSSVRFKREMGARVQEYAPIISRDVFPYWKKYTDNFPPYRN